MDWMQILFLFCANASIVIWFRMESRADWRHMDAKTDAIHQEIKDFHRRLECQDAKFKSHLCAIEEWRVRVGNKEE